MSNSEVFFTLASRGRFAVSLVFMALMGFVIAGCQTGNCHKSAGDKCASSEIEVLVFPEIKDGVIALLKTADWSREVEVSKVSDHSFEFTGVSIVLFRGEVLSASERKDYLVAVTMDGENRHVELFEKQTSGELKSKGTFVSGVPSFVEVYSLDPDKAERRHMSRIQSISLAE